MSNPDLDTQLLRLLSAQPQPTVDAMAESLGVNRRTVLRHIQALQREQPPRIGPYDASARRYPLTDASRRTPRTVRVAPEQLDALGLSAKTVAKQVGESAGRCLRELLCALGGSDGELAELLYIRPTFLVDRPDQNEEPRRPDSFTLIVDLLRAAHERRELRMEYFTARRQKLEHRTVEPRGLALIDDEWLLAAADPRDKGKVKDFALHRIHHYELGEVSARSAEPFQLSRHFEGKFRSIGEGSAVEVRLRFSRDASVYVRERIWHPSQVKIETADGLELKLRVAASVELEKWILGYGPDCEVLAPPTLRSRIAERLTAALRRYWKGEFPSQQEERT